MSKPGKLTLLLGLLTLGFSILIFGKAFEIRSLTGEYILDLRFWGSTPTEVAVFFASLGNGESLKAYQTLRTLDMGYPLAYGAFGAVWLCLLFRPTKWKWVAGLPMIAAVFDYLENHLIHKLSLLDSGKYTDLVSQMTLLTQLKYSAVLLSLICLFAGLFKHTKGGWNALDA